MRQKEEEKERKVKAIRQKARGRKVRQYTPKKEKRRMGRQKKKINNKRNGISLLPHGSWLLPSSLPFLTRPIYCSFKKC